ncbi:MAG TPA: NAD(P)/FAD-dependent oxidoreductase [Anaerolineae bacterium]|nr:NAD(P)/FAD-dependent oxidoreductase [Anaerolineae bacterium]
MYDLIIIGGGPAGLTAAIYAIRKRLETLLISKDLGGKTNFTLELPDVELHNVISGQEIIGKFRREIEYLDFAHVLDGAEKVETLERGYTVTTTSGKRFTAKALIVATGARGRRLNVPGEKEFMMRGLCYSAVSYAPLFIEKRAIVIGDRPLALRAAAELAQVANQVTLVAPEPDKLDTPLGRKLRKTKNVTVLEGFQVREVKGDRFARSVVVGSDGDVREIEMDAAFVELELLPRSEAVAHLVELDPQGRVKIDAENRTSRLGIFAAGDVTNIHAEQVLISVGEGAKAALSAYEYLLKEWD